MLRLLCFVMLLFVGILIYVGIESHKANPVILDEKGRIRSGAPAAQRQ